MKHNIIINAPEIAGEIKYAEILIDRILNYEYFKEEWDEYLEKYPFTKDNPITFVELSRKTRIEEEKDWNEFWNYLNSNLRNWLDQKEK
jgi:hypothetical protein